MKHPSRLVLGGTTTLAVLASLLLPANPASATSKLNSINGLASVAPNDSTGNNASEDPKVSDHGRFIAFSSAATDLVSGDTNGKSDIFVRDTLVGTTTLVSVSTQGGLGNANSTQPDISSDGRYVSFTSDANNLVANDTNGASDIFVRDLIAKTTVRVSLKDDDTQAAGASSFGVISGDGKTVAFQTTADALVPSDSNTKPDVYVRTLATGTTERITVTSTEIGLSAGGTSAAISSNGRFVLFDSTTTQMLPNNGAITDVFLRDRTLGTTEAVSLSGDGSSVPDAPSQFGTVSDDGRYVAFQSSATNLTQFTTGGKLHVYRRDRTTATTDLVDVTPGHNIGNAGSGGAYISGDGSKVVFSSDASTLVSGDTNGSTDEFVRDLTAGVTTRVSTKTGGGQQNGSSGDGAISVDGSVVGYSSLTTDGYSPDANHTFDVFWRGTYQSGPFTDSIPMLQQTAKDFTGAQLPLGTLVPLNNRVLTGIVSPGGAIVTMAHGTFDDDRGPVIRLYWAFFERLPDQGGLDHWTNKHASGTTLKQIANSFAESSEFINHYGPLSDTAFVTLVYQNVLQRNPDAAGLAHWVDRIEHGVTRGEMMTGFSESSEGKRRMRGESDSVLLYEGMDRRLPTPQEFTASVSLLESGTGQPSELLALIILFSNPYAARFP